VQDPLALDFLQAGHFHSSWLSSFWLPTWHRAAHLYMRKGPVVFWGIDLYLFRATHNRAGRGTDRATLHAPRSQHTSGINILQRG
jgi:hypothetical protein